MWRILMAQYDVPTGLVVHHIAELLERPDRFSTGDGRQAGQSGSSTVSSHIDGGIGSPCLRRLSR